MCYGVLVPISQCYPPVKGRLHTRYAPVRRSPSNPYCYFITLPLDLHVLSLPLAFILSQDQTLHCKKLKCFVRVLTVSIFPKRKLTDKYYTFLSIIKPVNQRTVFQFTFKLRILKWESGAKVRQIFETTKFFGNFFQKTFLRTFVRIALDFKSELRVQR